ncbi:hypothetical protein GPECTOR_8g122 [Gonium pectorale]|uniref:Uncharacterized protein n=1 Tax=Gonium pectorale TaxID=33097 RepID=A0A150GS71_GONPE|nr:hypothetical protein GPECTOR_8g122 [Gonium pectorale]|eukprot:KXZ52729.1 hypothetical protein GPECTOR_8g122 [Gonium pectorale]
MCSHVSFARAEAGAVLLRLLAWKRMALCTSSAEALKYVFVMGQQVPPSVPAEIRPLARLPGAFAVLTAGLDSSDPRVAARAGHFANLEHGVSSVLTWNGRQKHGVRNRLLYVVSCESAPDPALLAPPVWQSLAAHKPTLLLLSKGVKMTEAINVRAGGRPFPPQTDPRAAEALAAGWQSVLHEGAARRGLDADSASVVVAELRDSAPPGGVAGLSQVRDWLAAALEAATQR